MENIFSFDVFLINVPIYLAFVLAGYMLAIKPRHQKKVRAESFSKELYNSTEDLKLEKIEDFYLYLDIAKLARKNGEFEKAVQIHTKLLEKDGLPKVLEAKIILELGRDYQASGLFDLAEENLLIALKVSEKNSSREESCLLDLAKLYERQKAWKEAMECRKKLAQIDDRHNANLALLLCNLAKEEFAQKNIGNAKKLYQEALSFDKECVLSVKELATIHIIEGDYAKVFEEVEGYSLNSTKLLNLLAFAFNELLKQDEYKEKTVALLEKLVDQKSCDYELSILYCDYLLESDKKDELQSFISQYNDFHKNNLQAIYAMALFLKESKFDYKSKDHGNVLLEKIENMLDKSYNYQCGSCGYHTKHEFWQCPQCQKWDTVDRIHR